MDKVKNSVDLKRIWQFFKNIIHAEDVDYDQFESQIDGTNISTFRENDKAFRLFGTNVHVKVGAYIACAIGLVVTIFYCITYTFYHSRGMGRNPFIDQLELLDLVYAFAFGLPCHAMLYVGIKKEKKKYITPFLIFYLTNFVLNCVLTVVIFVAAMFDIHQQIFGNVKFDLSWSAFQIGFTSAQFLAIYVVMKCRKYVAAKNHWKRKNDERSNTIIEDAVSIDYIST